MNSVVLVVCHECDLSGGATRSLIDWLKNAKRSNYNYLVSIPNQGRKCVPLERKLDDMGIEHIRLPYIRETYSTEKVGGSVAVIKKVLSLVARDTFFFALEWASVRYARWSLRNRHIVAIVTNSSSCCFGFKLASLCRIPHLWYVRENLQKMHLSYPSKSFFLAATLNSWVIFISQTVARWYLDRGLFIREHSFVVYDRVELSTLPEPLSVFGGSKESCKIISVGSLSEIKRHDVSIRALAELRSRSINATLSIYGTGRLKKRLLVLIDSLGVGKYVQLHGCVSDLANEWKQYDIAVSSCEWEAFGRANVEAMFYGCLLIASNAGCNVVLTHDGANGVLFEEGDYCALADAIEKTLDDASEVDAMRRDAQQYAATFDRPIAAEIDQAITAMIKGYRSEQG